MGQLDIHIRHGHGGAELLGQLGAGLAAAAGAVIIAEAIARIIVPLLIILGLVLVLAAAALVLYLRRPQQPPRHRRPRPPWPNLATAGRRPIPGHNQSRPAPRQLTAPPGHVLAGWALDGEPIWRRLP